MDSKMPKSIQKRFCLFCLFFGSQVDIFKDVPIFIWASAISALFFNIGVAANNQIEFFWLGHL